MREPDRSRRRNSDEAPAPCRCAGLAGCRCCGRALNTSHESRVRSHAFRRLLLLMACLALAAGCTRQTPVVGITPLKAGNTAELQKYLLAHKPDVDLFRLRGPFRVTGKNDL